jgi:hypothetical protein
MVVAIARTKHGNNGFFVLTHSLVQSVYQGSASHATNGGWSLTALHESSTIAFVLDRNRVSQHQCGKPIGRAAREFTVTLQHNHTKLLRLSEPGGGNGL